MENKIKEDFLSKKPTIENELKAEILKCIQIIKKYNPYELLSQIVFHYKSTNFGIMKEADLDIKSMDSKILIKYYQMLISCINIEEFKNNKICQNDIYKIINSIKQIDLFINHYVLCLNFELENDYSAKETDYILQNLLYKNVSGKRYDFFELSHYKEIFEPLREEFNKCFGFSVDDLYKGILNLKNKFTFGVNSSLDEFDKFVNETKLEEVEKDIELQKKAQKIMLNMFGLELHNINDITNWPVEFIKLFSYELGDNKKFIDNVNFFEFIDLEKKIKDKPILKIDNDYYCFLIQEFLDSFDKKIIKEMCKILASDSEKLRAKHTSNVELIVQNLFLNVLPKSKSYLNNYYKYKRQMAENDLLIEYDKNLFIIEVKSGSYTPDLAIQNFKSHYESLKTLIVKADEQSERLSELLNENDSIEIYDSNKRDKKIKCVLNKKDFDNIYKIVITLENFNEHEARAEKLGFIKLNNNTLFISLDDLRVYSDYFENSPTIFMHYLNQRVLATRNEYVNLNDELDHLGMYIEYNMYSITADNLIKEHPNTTNIFFDGYREDLDEYYNNKYLKNSDIKKPMQNMPARISEIIEFCDSNRPENHFLLTNNMLDLALDNKKIINNTINQMINLFKNNYKPKYLFMTGDINFFIMSIYNAENFDINTYIDEAYANLLVTRKDSLIFAALYYDKEEKISKILIKQLFKEDKYNREKCEKLAIKIRENRIKKELIQKKKIGRNEMCPCGSGRKYKQCCGK